MKFTFYSGGRGLCSASRAMAASAFHLLAPPLSAAHLTPSILLGQLCLFGSPPLPYISIPCCQFAAPCPPVRVFYVPPPPQQALCAKSEVLEPMHGAQQIGQRIWHFCRPVGVRMPARERSLMRLEVGDPLLPLVLIVSYSFENEMILRDCERGWTAKE